MPNNYGKFASLPYFIMYVIYTGDQNNQGEDRNEVRCRVFLSV